MIAMTHHNQLCSSNAQLLICCKLNSVHINTYCKLNAVQQIRLILGPWLIKIKHLKIFLHKIVSISVKFKKNGNNLPFFWSYKIYQLSLRTSIGSGMEMVHQIVVELGNLQSKLTHMQTKPNQTHPE